LLAREASIPISIRAKGKDQGAKIRAKEKIKIKTNK